jgi:hypothetical protein
MIEQLGQTSEIILRVECGESAPACLGHGFLGIAAPRSHGTIAVSLRNHPLLRQSETLEHPPAIAPPNASAQLSPLALPARPLPGVKLPCGCVPEWPPHSPGSTAHRIGLRR